MLRTSRMGSAEARAGGISVSFASLHGVGALFPPCGGRGPKGRMRRPARRRRLMGARFARLLARPLIRPPPDLIRGSSATPGFSPGGKLFSHKGRRSLPSLVVARLGARGPARVLLGVGLGGFVDERLNLGRIRRDEIAYLDPFRAVPLLDEGRAVAVVVGARRLERSGEAVEPERLEARRVEVEVFQASAHVLSGHHLLAGDLLRFSYRLGD